MSIYKRFLASTLIASTLVMGLPATAQAGIVPTQDAMSTSSATVNRAQINTFLARADVRKGLMDQGIDVEAAQSRVNSLSDAEVAELAGRVDQAPAGGDVLGLMFTVFIVLLVTDILGLTKVFPFTRSVR
ncbi:MAG: PA2779 family protein [Rhodoferax sp.]|nr:PA2779 family protein [Rhodoferax sp.]